MTRIAVATLIAAIVVIAAACSEKSPAGPDDSVISVPDGMVVSNALISRMATSGTGVSNSQSGSATTIAYLSAVPGTFPNAVSISISNKTKPAAAKTATVTDGGFDPIGIEAENGDELSLAVSLTTGGLTLMTVKVPPRRPPEIVRTSPSKGRTDVAVNTNIVVVFSEPIEISSVTPASLTLTRDKTPVKGRILVSDDRLSAEFIPDSALALSTTYSLAVDPGIRDLDGESLGETSTVTFGTAGSTTSGAIEVSVSTSGPDQDADGYTLSAQAPSTYQWARLAVTGTSTLTGTEAGNVSVMLYGLAPNCALTSPNPQVVNVKVGVTAKASFAVTCVASGSVRLTTVTTGVALDMDGYSMYDRNRSDIGHSFSTGLDLGLSPNGTITASALAPGTYVVGIQDIAPNCEPIDSATQTITIVAGVESSLRFEVTCFGTTQIAFVRGEDWDDSNVANTEIYVVQSNGTGTARLTSEPGADINPAWSPDGRKIAFASDRAGNREIYVMNADGTDPVRLTNHAAADYLPAYSPDGKRIAFVSERDGNAEIYVMNSDGTNQSRLTNNGADDLGPAWSPDGSRIAFSQMGDIFVMRVDGSGMARLTSDAASDTQPAWSPDGNTIAFRSEGRNASRGIYLMNSDGSNIKRILGDGYYPSSPDWSPDGRLVAYDDWDCWDFGPCPRGIVIGTIDGKYSTTINDAAEPAWSRR